MHESAGTAAAGRALTRRQAQMALRVERGEVTYRDRDIAWFIGEVPATNQLGRTLRELRGPAMGVIEVSATAPADDEGRVPVELTAAGRDRLRSGDRSARSTRSAGTGVTGEGGGAPA